MADEEEVEVVEEKKGGLVKILLFVTIGLLLIIISVGATLFLSGFFDPKPNNEGILGAFIIQIYDKITEDTFINHSLSLL